MNSIDSIKNERKKRLTRKRILFCATAVVIAAIAIIVFFSAPVQRAVKSLYSDYTGGLNRTVTVYDYMGRPIEKYSGKFSIKESDNKVMFDNPKTGKRVIIYNSPVIAEEE